MSLDWSFTNLEEQSCKLVKLECSPFWEYWQQDIIKRLSNLQDPQKNIYKLEPGYEARARRIAATYAKFFLEKKDVGGVENLIGRFYWMGLGAFASKTVGTIFHHIGSRGGYQVRANESSWYVYVWNLLAKTGAVNEMPEAFDAKEAIDTFALGNFWLAMDIAPWHFGWSACRKSFQDCIGKRDTRSFENIKTVIDNLVWSECLPSINYLQATDAIRKAFGYLPDIEAIFNTNVSESEKYERAQDNLKNHLLAIAEQEQKNILQEITWSNGAMRAGAALERSGVRWALPDSTLVLSSDYSVSSVKKSTYYYVDPLGGSYHGSSYGDSRHNDVLPHLKNEVYIEPLSDSAHPDDKLKNTVVEDYDSRMEWIKVAAQTYHDLMLDDKGRDFLCKELETIAGWDQSSLELKRVDHGSNQGKR